jgi:hypothetical protein
VDVGPELEWLTRRLAECPPEFLLPIGSGKGKLDIEALVGDLLRDLGLTVVSAEETSPFAPNRYPKEAQALLAICCWLLHDDWFRRQGRFAVPARIFLCKGLLELAKLVRAEQFVRDPDRREELVRLTLRALDLIPASETETAALDRLTTLSSVERKRVLDATKAARDHAERVRKAMAEQAAAESAARYGRE